MLQDVRQLRPAGGSRCEMVGWRALAAVLALVAAVLLCVLRGAGSQARRLVTKGWTVPLGNVAEGVAAVGGLGTFGILAVAWMVFRSDQSQRAKDDKDRQDDEDRKQA